MDGDSDDEFIPHPGTITKIHTNIADLDNIYAHELLTFQAISLSLQDHLRYRKNIIADIKRLQSPDNTAPSTELTLTASINKLMAQKSRETEEIAELVAGMDRVRARILDSIHEQACLYAELEFAHRVF